LQKLAKLFNRIEETEKISSVDPTSLPRSLLFLGKEFVTDLLDSAGERVKEAKESIERRTKEIEAKVEIPPKQDCRIM